MRSHLPFLVTRLLACPATARLLADLTLRRSRTGGLLGSRSHLMWAGCSVRIDRLPHVATGSRTLVLEFDAASTLRSRE